MRLIPILAAALLATTAAIAQPYGDPSQQQGGPPPQQMAPDDNMPPPQNQPAPPAGQRHHAGKLAERFEAANVTHDGRLTMEQAQGGHMRSIARHFAEIDTDRKGYITIQDIKTWHHAMKRAKAQEAQAPGQQMPPPPPQQQYQAPPQ